MELICFVPLNKHLSRLNSDVLDDLKSVDNVDIYKTFENFSERLSRPKKLDTIIIIIAESRQDFEKLISYKDFLNNTRNIMVLPDREKETLDLALLFFPRFYIFADQDFKQIGEVVRKCTKNLQREKTIRTKKSINGKCKKINKANKNTT